MSIELNYLAKHYLRFVCVLQVSLSRVGETEARTRGVLFQGLIRAIVHLLSEPAVGRNGRHKVLGARN